MSQHPSARSIWALVAAVWALSFGLLHLAWSLGSRFALHDAAAAEAAFDQAWFQFYNVAVTAASFVAAAAAATLLRPQPAGSRISRAIVWTAGVMLLARGALGAGEFVLRAVTGTATGPLRAWTVDAFMLAGGAIFFIAAWYGQHGVSGEGFRLERPASGNAERAR